MPDVLPSQTISPKGFNRKRWLLRLLAVVAIAGVGGSFYFYGKYHAIKTNPNAAAQKEVEKLVATVSKLMELPTGETPTVATISDKAKLKDQPFFKTAANGDKLFVYNAAMLAILYRPATNKIINVAPISITQPNAATGASDASLRIAYFNGSPTVGRSTLAEKAVTEKYPNWKTASLTSASKKNYHGTLVIDLSGQHPQAAADLAGLLNGQTGSLPPGEVAPAADILIISGE